MIYLLYGTDTQKARAKLRALVDALQAKKPDASYVKVTAENFQPESLDELLGGQGLFEHKMIVEMDMLFKNKELKPLILDRLDEIGESENIFVFLEEKLLKPEVTKFAKYSDKVQEFALAEKPEKKEQNFFSMADALGRRDKKQLWVLYTKALQSDAAPEELHGILFWQIKSMLLAQKSKDAKAAGLHPFVYQKSIGFSKNFKESELEAISAKLVKIYHDARRGKMELEPAIEKFILEL